ncbi:MAG TPA: 30S ribosomal protein S20 [Thermoanaerobaculia bacterium]|jgi:small subunit ribosomal protein S20
MANIQSAEKRMRQTARRQKRNRGVRTRLRSTLKTYRSASEKDQSQMIGATVSEIDRALKKGVIHRNAAARYKSRLARNAQATKASKPAAAPKAKPASKASKG